ncbi:putative adrenomedullin-5-like protein isoform X2 [Rhinopithecus roxellana]|uniref:putative adrenomedullin-5-like protein isoform X2 n=1 Tax=Rhinopithecus roxellana TaxID=61622 RepID=UPI0012370B4B|nr:putative adrenomedullin-5-like protein isoform X2 [Rhinopithecus roxellana]
MGSYGCNYGPRILTLPAHILILLLLLAFSPRGTRILQPGALREGQPRAPGPLQLWAPPVARGGSPARFPGLRPAARGPAQCPARWVTSGTARPLLGFSLPIRISDLLPHVSSPLTPAPETVFPSPSPG